MLRCTSSNPFPLACVALGILTCLAAGGVPIARIEASALSGSPALEVDFSAASSTEPRGDPLGFLWIFGDGSDPLQGSVVSHTYEAAGIYLVKLRATNQADGSFGETSVVALVWNSSPTAVIKANLTSGSVPLSVRFSGVGSSDPETAQADLIYQWDFGDGTTANSQGNPGLQTATLFHTYSVRSDGSACSGLAPCKFVAELTVTNELGKADTAAISILVGNSDPVACVTVSPSEGPAPLTVEFNASCTVDPDDDVETLIVDWDWGDGTASLAFPLSGIIDSSGLVLHTYAVARADGLPYKPTATIRDSRGGAAVWAGTDILVWPPPDCNGNGNPDSTDLADGTSRDLNHNQVPDECETLGDFDEDVDTDLDDYSIFEVCLGLSGPGVTPPFPSCTAVFDFDIDGFVDLRDFAVFQLEFSGGGE